MTMDANSTIFFIGLAPFVVGLIGIAILLRSSWRAPQTLQAGVLGTSLTDLRRQRLRSHRALTHNGTRAVAALIAEFAPRVEQAPAHDGRDDAVDVDGPSLRHAA